MKLALANPEDLRKLAAESYADAFTGDEIVVEALRVELAARRVANRRSLCERVCSQLAPVHEATPETVRATLEALEKARDATPGPGGFVAASPVRVIPIGAGRFRLFGTLSSSYLRRVLGVAVRPSSWGRLAEPLDAVAFAGAVERIGGAVLPPERWAGLDTVLPAGPAWLEGLSEELENLEPGDGVTSIGADGEWRVYRPLARGEVSATRWYRAAPGDEGRLWRTKTESGWFEYAFTGGGEPKAGLGLRLRVDDALRTQFALDRKSGCPQSLRIERAGTRTLLELTVFLPRAEYRYLATLGEPASDTSGKRVLAFQTSVWDAVEGTLHERLGVETDERGA